MKILIETIPHHCQKYETSGDWRWVDGDLYITVSDMKNWRYFVLVAVHEFIEAMYCKSDRVKEKDVTAFDIRFEKERKAGKHSKTEEPGDSPISPYLKQHRFATMVERSLAIALHVDWEKYDKKVMSL